MSISKCPGCGTPMEVAPCEGCGKDMRLDGRVYGTCLNPGCEVHISRWEPRPADVKIEEAEEAHRKVAHLLVYTMQVEADLNRALDAAKELRSKLDGESYENGRPSQLEELLARTKWIEDK